eukprot:2490326-Amphidinium_carterae.1
MNAYLGTRGGPLTDGSAARMTTYLNSVFHGMHPPKEVGPRNAAELKMLANTIDELSSGNLPR